MPKSLLVRKSQLFSPVSLDSSTLLVSSSNTDYVEPTSLDSNKNMMQGAFRIQSNHPSEFKRLPCDQLKEQKEGPKVAEEKREG